MKKESAGMTLQIVLWKMFRRKENGEFMKPQNHNRIITNGRLFFITQSLRNRRVCAAAPNRRWKIFRRSGEI